MSADNLSEQDAGFLRQAALHLERPGLLVKLVEAANKPLNQAAQQVMPKGVDEIVRSVLLRLMELASNTVWAPHPKEEEIHEAYKRAGWHGFWNQLELTAISVTTGLFGLPGLLAELPISTTIMFRSIGSIAHDFGENLDDPMVRLECINVFTYGMPAVSTAATTTPPMTPDLPSAYLGARGMMANLTREATQFIQSHLGQVMGKIVAGTAPPLQAYMARLAGYLNVIVSEKFLAQSVPIFAAATGAAINFAFSGHFNDVAIQHFTIRKLERQYGADVVLSTYRSTVSHLRATGALPSQNS